MNYIINTTTLEIISGPHSLNSSEVKKHLRTGNPDTMTEAAQIARGVVPEVRPTLTASQALGAQVVEADRVTWAVADKTPEQVTALRQQLRDQIDLAVDAARGRHVSAGAYIVEEYRIARDQAVEWGQRVPPRSGAVPRSVAAWALGLTPEQAADDILASGNGLEWLIETTREIRLAQREAVSTAKTLAEAQAITDATLAQLAAL